MDKLDELHELHKLHKQHKANRGPEAKANLGPTPRLLAREPLRSTPTMTTANPITRRHCEFDPGGQFNSPT